MNVMVSVCKVDMDMTLLAEKAIFLTKHAILIIADLHLGKIEHFRKSGLALPSQAGTHTLKKLHDLLLKYEAKEVVFLGDLFHSDPNQSMEAFQAFINTFWKIKFHLVIGNHDTYSIKTYESLGLHAKHSMTIGRLWLTHEPMSDAVNDHYCLSGHLHPCVKLRGMGKQSLTLPCFYFGQHQGILPAFGYFTGSHKLVLEDGADIFAIGDQHVYQITNHENNPYR